MNKLTVSLLSGLVLMLVGVAPVFAAPFNAENNPQIVANFPTGDHGVVGESDTHNGADVVMRAGDSGNFQQWFYGTSTENGGIIEGDHSVWMHVGSSTTCPNDDWDLVVNANQSWGDYLEPGNYCVHTNDFHVQDL